MVHPVDTYSAEAEGPAELSLLALTIIPTSTLVSVSVSGKLERRVPRCPASLIIHSALPLGLGSEGVTTAAAAATGLGKLVASSCFEALRSRPETTTG